MSMVTLEESNFDKIVHSNNIVLIDCWAQWATACAAFAPIYERVASKYPNHIFGILDTQSQTDLVEKLGLENIPSLLVYKDGILLLKQPGYLAEEQIEDIFHRVASLNRETVYTDKEREFNCKSEKAA